MKPEYIEGSKAQENFEEGMKAKGLHVVFLALFYDLRSHFAATFHKSHDYGLVIVEPAREFSLSRLVHVPRFAADESLVNFHTFAAAAKFVV